MKTYIERRIEESHENGINCASLKVFDWNQFLSREWINHSWDEINKARDLAGDWVTCACGNQCDIIPRDYFGAPVDHTLKMLGNQFSTAIAIVRIRWRDAEYGKTATDEFDTARHVARRTLELIEQRSAELINEIQQLKNINNDVHRFKGQGDVRLEWLPEQGHE